MEVFRHGHGGRHSTMRIAYIKLSLVIVLQSIHSSQSYSNLFARPRNALFDRNLRLAEVWDTCIRSSSKCSL